MRWFVYSKESLRLEQNIVGVPAFPGLSPSELFKTKPCGRDGRPVSLRVEGVPVANCRYALDSLCKEGACAPSYERLILARTSVVEVPSVH